MVDESPCPAPATAGQEFKPGLEPTLIQQCPAVAGRYQRGLHWRVLFPA